MNNSEIVLNNKKLIKFIKIVIKILTINVKITKARSSDCEEVLRLLKELKVSGYAEMGMEDVEVKKADNADDFFCAMLDRDDVFILIAKEGEESIGLGIAYLTPKIFDGNFRMVIEEMVVNPEHRGKGIGSLLLGALEKVAMENDVKVIKLTTGTELKANEFYKKHGYVHFENAYRKKIGE